MERGPESRLGALAERDRKKKASKSKKAKRKCVSPSPPLSTFLCLLCFKAAAGEMIDRSRVLIDERIRYAKLEADRRASDSEGEVESGDEEDHAENSEGESANEQGDRAVGMSEPRSASVLEGKTITGTRSEETALDDSKLPNSGKGING